MRPYVAALALSLGVMLAAPKVSAQEGFDFSPEQTGRVRAERDEAAIAALPTGFTFAREGYLTVAINPGTPPIATYASDASTIIGADPDIAQLIADSFGLELDLQSVAWADWPLGVASGRYDVAISNVGVTEERKEKFDFSTYRQGLHGFFVLSDSGITAIREPKDTAGLRIIVTPGTNQERILLEWSRQNEEAGLEPIELQYYDDEATRLVALAAGRADVIVQPHAQLVFIAARDGNIRRVGTLSAGWPLTSDVAVTTRKGSGLAEPISIAINSLMAHGTYAKALERWHIAEEALPRSETNPPGLPKY